MKQFLRLFFTEAWQTQPSAGRWPLALRRGLYLIGMNAAIQLPFWVAERFYSFQRPLFNYDLVIALLGFCVSAWLGWGLLLGALTIDVIRIASLNYHFLNLADFIESARFAGLLSLGSFVSPGLVLLVVCVLAYVVCIARWLRRWLSRLVVEQILLLFLLVGLDSLNGSMQFFHTGLDRFRLPLNIAGSPTWNLYRMQQAQQPGKAGDVLTPMPSIVRESMQGWHTAHPDRSMMLVLVESMGQPKSMAVRDWLAQQAQPLGVAERWSIRAGEEVFHGSTTHGELRVLCGLDGRYDSVDAALSPQCLPGQLSAQGFDAVGYHGFQLTMFNRARWWQLVGLKPHVFDYQHAAPEAKDCHNVFHGMCDAEMLREAIAHVQEERRFSYVVTLDTHLPLPAAAGSVPDDVRTICGRENLSERSCELVNQLGGVLRTLGSQLAAGSGTPYVAIVGDHAPPFLARESRTEFLPDKVPFLLLEPKR